LRLVSVKGWGILKMNIRLRYKKNIDIKNTKKQPFGAVLRRKERTSVLFSRGKISETFFTEDSKLYITPREQLLLRKGIELNKNLKKWDSISSRVVLNYSRYEPNETSQLIKLLKKRYALLGDSIVQAQESFASQLSLVRLWNMSIVGSILFGMVIMTFVYKYLGQGVSAEQLQAGAISEQQISQSGEVLGAESSSDDAQALTRQILEAEKANDRQSLEKEIKAMVKGYPIEKMVPYIAEKDRTVAAFIVGIAKKESGWGQHVPVLNGQDCYNYWGYRGLRKLMGTGGHTCFNSPKDAVDTVSKRIATLIDEYGKNTPEKMVIWKCGSDCSATGGQAAANKWISDVTMYFNKLNTED
jgi:hypothetical protein